MKYINFKRYKFSTIAKYINSISYKFLKDFNYKGWLVVEAEQDPAKANPFEYAKIGYKYLTETLKKSNIEIYN